MSISVYQEHDIFCEKYRPVTINDYIGNEHIKEKIGQYLQKEDIPHLLLYGPPGTGKCLDFSEEINIEIDLTDEEFSKLSKYVVK